jgi:hypothetical protein
MSVATAAELTELELLHLYLGRRISNGGRTLSLELVLREFQEFRRQLEDVREKLREAEQSSAQGLARTVDRETLKQEVRAMLVAKGAAT